MPAAAPATPSRSQKWIAWLMVAVQFGLIAVIVLAPGSDVWRLSPATSVLLRIASWTGIVIMVAGAVGLQRGLTAAPLPNAHAQLRDGGLYRLVRHPIYSGLLLFAVASAASSRSLVVSAACVLLVALIAVKARWEERRLAERFPDYAAYAARTPRFVPHLLPRD